MTPASEQGPEHSIDAFHRGDFWLVQPRNAGHRAGMDALILAAAVPTSFSGRLADFGAGAGAAGLAVGSRCADARIVLVEQSREMARYAQLTISHSANEHLAERISIVEADVTLAGKARTAAGLADNSFDFVIMNPPFNAAIDRSTPDPLRKQAHVMNDGLFENWLRSAAAVTRPRGGLAVISRPESLAEILAALDGRFGSAQIMPIHPRPDRPAIRIVLRARLGARGALTLHPPLYLHDSTGNRLCARAEAVSNGKTSLFGD
jgi:tRNA1(Val) A37 N6-methylase TrmN6